VITAGIDIGSRNTKLVVIENGVPCEWGLLPTGADPIGAVSALIKGRHFDRVAATGYGRKLAESGVADMALTEIKACAIGAHHMLPECRTVIDIGGQDTKGIALDGKGGFNDFAMNDRCAAGTGRFLEMIAGTLGYTLDEFGQVSCGITSTFRLNSMCAVFAESEVISLIARGAKGPEIARAVHEAMVDRIAVMVRSMNHPIQTPMLAGGVAHNLCIVQLLENKLGVKIAVPERAQFTAAIGAAIWSSIN